MQFRSELQLIFLTLAAVFFQFNSVIAAPSNPQVEADMKTLSGFISSFESEMPKWEHKLALAKTKKEKEAINAEYPKTKLVKSLLDLAMNHPADAVGRTASAWILSVNYNDENAIKQAALILKSHLLDSDELNICIQTIASSPNKDCQDLLKAVAEKSNNKRIRYYACLRRAEYLFQHSPIESDKELRHLLNEVVQGGGNLIAEPRFRRTLKQMAEQDIYEFDHLQVGKLAPNIKGVDVDGKTISLLDYRGSVVLLDFFGFW